MLLLVAFLAGPLCAQTAIPNQSAVEQIHAITALKKSQTVAQRKLDSRLWVESLRERRDPAATQLPSFATGIEVDGAGRVLLDLRAEVTDELLLVIDDLGGSVESAFPRWKTLRARLPLRAVEELARRPEVRGIRPADQMMLHGNTTTTEGDVAHGADMARARFAVDGTGVTSCAMSDSVDELANLQAAGELPPGVTVLAGQSGNPGSSEGTALLEIIHDLAPGASLGFATGAGGQAQMAQNILDLAAAGCQVMVDDVFYFGEPPFQDGVIAQAVDQVAANGVFYLSSAGNSGRLSAGTSGVWEGDYAATALPAPLVGTGLSAHDFGGGSASNQVTEQAQNDAPFFTLWWSDPTGSSDNDYDLYLLDEELANVVAFSVNVQDGDDDSFEIINSIGVDHSNHQLVVVKVSGDDRFLQLNTHRGILEAGTNGQISGHPAAEGAIAVGAVGAFTAGGGPFTGGAANPAEPFSSDGPRRIFFQANGDPVAPAVAGSPLLGGQSSVVRDKPDIVAADGVSTTTPGFETFFGTSASAPHASGILSLLRSLNPSLPLDDLIDRIFSTSLDIEDPGFDPDSGSGIIMTEDLMTPIFADGFESGDVSSWTSQEP